MKNFLKSYSLIIIFVIVSTIIVVMAFYSHSLTEFFVETSSHNIRTKLVETGKRLSELYTVEELSVYKTAEDMQKPEYQQLKRHLAEFAEDSDVLYAYYFQIENGMITYIVDNDFDPETVVGIDTPPYDPGESIPLMEGAKAGEITVSELGQYVPGWEGLISAYIPMFDADGNAVIFAGVDMDDSEIVHARTRTRILMFMEIVAILAVILFGIYAFGKYRKEAITAKKADEAKSKFLSLISHEIRTPMNAILGITEILLRDETLTADAEKWMEEVHDSGNLLLGIVNDILDMSNVEAGRLEITPARYDIPNLINDTVHINRVRYSKKPIELILDIDENTPFYLIGDELRIKQILNNFLSNAFKYTEGGEITLKVSVANFDDNHVSGDVILTISVSDTGQGLSEEELGRLFTEYTRFHQEANRRTIGIGLGLSITKHLVDMMDGEISVESEVGKGSTFTVSLPQKRAGELVCGSEIVEKLRNFELQSTSLLKRGDVPRDFMPYGSILVVDDIPINISVVEGLLAPYNLKVEAAESGFKAIDLVKAGNTYDIIFMDHMMPEMDGIETVKRLREMGYTGSIVALSANALVGHADMFLQNGFDGYISKPIDSRELNLILHEHIRGKKPKEVEEEARQMGS